LLKNLIFCLLPLIAAASWEEVAVKGLDVVISANVGDSENFKNSLSTLIERAANEYEHTGVQDYELDLPSYITERAGKKSIAVQNMQRLASKKLSLAVEPIKKLVLAKIKDMSEADTKAVMSGEVLFSHYLRTNAFDEIYEIIRPLARELGADASFAKSFKSAVGREPGDDFSSEFSSAFINESFDFLSKNEREFRKNSGAILNAIKTIR
jgi:hypothetical protein